MRTSISLIASTNEISCPLPIGKPASRNSRPNVSMLRVRRPGVMSSGLRLTLRGTAGGALNKCLRLIAANPIDVLLVFQDDAQRIVDSFRSQFGRAQREQGLRPVERFRHSRRLEEIDFAQPLREGADLVSQALAGFGDLGRQNSKFFREGWEVNPVIEAAALECIV